MSTLSATFEDEWEHIDGVEDAGYAFSATRGHRGATPTAPASGVKVRRSNPTQNELAIAAGTVGLDSTDCIWTIWADTLRSGGASDGALIVPETEDTLTTDDGDYRILSVRRTVDGHQYRCYSRKSVL